MDKYGNNLENFYLIGTPAVHDEKMNSINFKG